MSLSFKVLNILCLPPEPLDPKNLCTVFVSPRQRAHTTFHYLFANVHPTPDHVISEELTEWDYGEYEGLLSHEIRALNPTWEIWKDGYVV